MLQNPRQLPEDPRREIATYNVPAGPAPIQIQVVTSTENQTVAKAESSGGEYGAAIWRRKWAILAIAVLCAIAAFAIAVPQAPVYQARAAIEIQGVNQNFLNFHEVDPTAPPANLSAETYMQTEVRMLQDDSLVEKVAEKMKLEL